MLVSQYNVLTLSCWLQHVHKNGKSDNFLENGVAHLVASNASLSKLIKAIIVLVIITLIVNLLNLYGLKQFEARSTDEKRDVPIFLPLQSHSTLQSNKPIVWFSGRRVITIIYTFYETLIHYIIYG